MIGRTFRIIGLLSALSCLACPSASTRTDHAQVAPGTTAGMVAAFFPVSRNAGLAALRDGGTAVDAFIALTLVDYVVAPGFTSLAGPLAALTLDGRTGEVCSLDATFDAVRDPRGLFNPNQPSLGASVLVPGALRGLEALWRRHGGLPWARLVEPARALAEGGFEVDASYAAGVDLSRDVLARTDYGRKTFLPNGRPVAVGALLRQPELAQFLGEVAARGADAMYAGAWGQSFVEVINSNGGRAALSDLSGYEARWLALWEVDALGAKVHANSGRSYGGLVGLLGLSVLAHDSRVPQALSETDRLETRLRVVRAIYEDPWFITARNLDDHAWVDSRLAAPATSEVWMKVAPRSTGLARVVVGSHSLCATVVDASGNVITATHTINADPWGSGLFVQGVPLTDAGRFTALVPGPGERVVNGLSMHIATRNGNLEFAGATFGSSLIEIELQLVADALEMGATAADLRSRPRFGSYVLDPITNQLNTALNVVDSSIGDDVVAGLARRGLSVARDAKNAWKWGAFIVHEPDGSLRGATLDYPFLRGSVSELP